MYQCPYCDHTLAQDPENDDRVLCHECMKSFDLDAVAKLAGEKAAGGDAESNAENAQALSDLAQAEGAETKAGSIGVLPLIGICCALVGDLLARTFMLNFGLPFFGAGVVLGILSFDGKKKSMRENVAAVTCVLFSAIYLIAAVISSTS